MPLISSEERAVAFIDVIGFKSVVKLAFENENFFELETLITLLESAIPSLDTEAHSSVPKKLLPKHIYISDSIILSAPLKCDLPEWSQYSGVDLIVMRAIQITRALLDYGYLVRGGISIGRVWHTASNIVGPAYQDAVGIEKSTCMPRIVLSESAKHIWESGICSDERMCIDYDENFMVNGLQEFNHQRNDFKKGIEEMLGHFITIASSKEKECTKQAHKDKWLWFTNYLLSERQYWGFD